MEVQEVGACTYFRDVGERADAGVDGPRSPVLAQQLRVKVRVRLHQQTGPPSRLVCFRTIRLQSYF